MTRYLISFFLLLAAHSVSAATFTQDFHITESDTSYDGQDIVVLGATLTIDGVHTFASLTVSSNAVVTTSTGKSLDITSPVIRVESGSSINANARGALSTAAVTAYSGGSYGGQGGVYSTGTTNASYGDYRAPTDLGTGGYYSAGNRNRGGGALKLVADELVLDGAIVADGGYQSNAGGGSGGSVWLDVGVLSGRGQISANGGNRGTSQSRTNGGGGGRIAIYFSDASGFDLAGRVTAYGGVGSSTTQTGGAGTIYLKAASAVVGDLRIINPSNFSFNQVAVTNVTAESIGALQVGYARLSISGPLSLASLHNRGGYVWTDGGQITISDQLDIVNGGLVGPSAGNFLNIKAGSVYVDETSRFDADSRGNLPTAAVTAYSGGSYGGQGGVYSTGTTNASYGDYRAPTELGTGGYYSAGNRNRGGGALKLVADELVLDGAIVADGGYQSNAGGGSGGSVWLDVGVLGGSGRISANGGNRGTSQARTNGGGGGRIAIYFSDASGFDLAGRVTAYGGSGNSSRQAGGAGTIYLKAASAVVGDLRVVNPASYDYNRVAVTDISGEALGALQTGHARIAISGPLSLASLHNSGAYVWTDGGQIMISDRLDIVEGGLVGPSTGNLLDIRAGSIYVDETSRFDADSRGNLPTAAVTAYSGGSYGGQGGVYSTGTTNASYGDYRAPTDLGTGGYYSAGNRNRGGGALKLVADELVLDGAIVADGGYQSNAGGGSGGSVWLDVGVLSGSGQISANGGNRGTSQSRTNGGGGGRIAIYFSDASGFDLAGRVTAYGGVGSSTTQTGGAGTIYLKQQNEATGTLLIASTVFDSGNAITEVIGGSPGQLHVLNSRVAIAGAMNLTTFRNEGGDVWTRGGALDISGKLELLTGGLLRADNEATLNVKAATVYVDLDSVFNVTGKGSYPTSAVTAYSGGSYGGQGGVYSTGTTNASYGDYRAPTELGTGGYYSAGNRSRGGGALKLVADELVLDGAIVADGGYQQNAGGGSGGSVWLDVGVLSGSGQISANGGNRGTNQSRTSGGGGGRIAIYFSDASGFDLQDMVTVNGGSAGGSSGNPGEPGTIYLGEKNDPPYVVSHTPDGLNNQAIQTVHLRFSNEIDPATFTPDKIIVLRNNETPYTPEIIREGATDYSLRFAPALDNGDYLVRLSAGIQGINGFALIAKPGDVPGANPYPYEFSFKVDTAPPEAPTVTSFQVLPEVNIVTTHQIELQGTRTAESRIWVNGTSRVGSGATDWSLKLTLVEGENELRVQAGDEAGNLSDPIVLKIIADTTAPVTGAVVPGDGQFLPERSPMISVAYVETASGLDMSNTALSVTKEGAPVSGNWSDSGDSLLFTPSLSLLDGTYRIEATLVDKAGHSSSPFVSQFTVDTLPPAAPLLVDAPDTTTINTVTLNGTKEANSAILIDGVEVSPVDAATSWTTNRALNAGSNTLQITARDRAGNVSAETVHEIRYDDTAPGPVTVSVADPSTGTTLDLSWTNYDEWAQGNDIDHYNIYVENAAFTDVTPLTTKAAVPVGTKSHTLSGLTRNQQYFIAVVAVDSSNNMVPAVNAVSATPHDATAPEDPAGLTVSVAQSSIVLSWNAATDTAADLAGYRLYVDGAFLTETTPDVLTHTLTSLDPATAYNLTLKSIDVSGNESNGASITAVTVMANPSGLAAEPFSGLVDISWAAVSPAQYVDHYAVYVSKAGFSTVEGMTPAVTVPAGQTSARVAGLENEVPYYFAVSTVNLSGGEAKDVTNISSTPEPDREGPQISSIAYGGVELVDGNTLQQSSILTVAANDPIGVSRAEFLLGGEVIGSDTRISDGLSISLDLSTLSDGSYTLGVTVYDTLDNPTTRERQVTVALAAPAAPQLTSPNNGLTTNTTVQEISGAAEPKSEVTFSINGTVAGTPVTADSAGQFTSTLNLNEGENRIAATASNRGGTGPQSNLVLVTLDTTIPGAPSGLLAESKANGVITLSWNLAEDRNVDGYDVYRSTQAFTDIASAAKVNSAAINDSRYDDMPLVDDEYYYRVVALNDLGTPSLPSNAVTAKSDSVSPRALSIEYSPQGNVDTATGRIAPGQVDVTLTLNEALVTTPFLSLAPDGGVPIAVSLTKSGEMEYRGQFILSENTISGTAYAVFSARDLAGNRGTEIEQGLSLIFDTDGPEVTVLNIAPASPIKNDEANPAVINLEFTLDQPVKVGSIPSFAYRLSGVGRSDTPITDLNAVDELTWRGSFTLPSDAGLSEVEWLEFLYSAVDDLDNTGSRIRATNRFQVYQGDLPPLAIPANLEAIGLAGGKVSLSWRVVEGAAAYQLYRKGPGEGALIAYQRIEHPSYIDLNAGDGDYTYAVASIRDENGQEALSGQSSPVTVTADGTAPAAPQNLSLELVGAGIKAIWEASPGGETELQYRLYRAEGQVLTAVDTATLVQSNIVANTAGVLGYIDTRPDQTQPTYAVTAVDASGNESPLSESAYLNIDLLPVSTLEVTLNDASYPEVSWSHTGGNIVGYNLYLGVEGVNGTPVNSSPMTATSYSDSGYTGGVRTYTVTAIDSNGVESVGRSVALPALTTQLQADSLVKRGIFNQLDYQVTNNGSSAVSGVRITSVLGGRSNSSSSYTIAAGESLLIPVVVGGFDDLPGLADLSTTVTVTSDTSETVKINQQSQQEIGDSALVLSLQTRDMQRGTAGQVRFTLDNTSAVPTEIITALNSGNSDSGDIKLQLRDLDGNVLSTAPFRQAVGEGVLTLSNKTTVAGIEPGTRFTSAWTGLPVPENAPDNVTVELLIDKLHYHVGKDDHLAINGLNSSAEASLVDTAYSATVGDISPSTSSGDEPVVITGQALFRQDGTALAGVSVKLVIAVDGFERTAEVITDDQGNYRYEFTPLPGESGVFSVSAIHPDMLSRPAQGEFVITRVVVTPNQMNLDMAYGKDNSFNVIKAQTGAATTATNLHLVYQASDQPQGVLPEGVTVTLPDSLTLGPNTSAGLSLTINAPGTAAADGTLVLTAYSDESSTRALGKITVKYHFYEPQAAQPVINFTPNYVETGVGQGKGADETITLRNNGRAPLEGVNVKLITADTEEPAPSWLYLSSPAQQDDIAVGEQRSINLVVRPGTTVAEGIYPFKLRITSANYPVTDINIFVTVTAPTAGGDVLFKVSDIYTATLDENGNPIYGLAGARVRVQNEDDLSIEQSTTTDNFGEALFNNLPAGRYIYRASASNHQDEIGYFSVKAGVTATQEVMLDYNLVTVEWSVTEITIEDVYEITLEATFETDVPAAVLVIEPTSTILPQMSVGDVFQGELRLTNYGLIRADHLEFNFPGEDTYFRYEFQHGLPDSMEAKESIVIPYRVIALSPTQSDGSGTGGICSTYVQTIEVNADFECANGEVSNTTARHAWTQTVSSASCGSSGSGGGRPVIYSGGGGGGGGGGGSISGGGITSTNTPSSIAGAQCIPEPEECPVCEGLDQFGGGQAGGPYGGGGTGGSGPLQ